MQELGRKHKEVLDREWYAEFQEYGSFQAYEYFDGYKDAREQTRQSFLSGEVQNPTLDYPKLNEADLLDKERALVALKKEVLEREPNEIVKQVYRWRINEKLAEVRMMKAAASGDMHRFARYSEFVYGKPSTEIFTYTVSSIRSKAEKSLASENQDEQEAAQALLDMLPVPETETSFTLPSKLDQEEAIKETEKLTNNLITIPEGLENANAQEIHDAFTYALQQLEVEGWNVIIEDDSSKTTVSVNQEMKQVTIPASRAASVKKLSELIVHEIGTHVARREAGERSKLLLLGLGLDRYEGGEEGVATMREQAFAGKVLDFSGLDGHLAISLAKGLDGTKRDFRETYSVLYAYNYWNQLRLKKSKEVAEKRAQEISWTRTVRTFRGSDAKTPGACFTKDIIYREGNMGVWNVIRTNPSELARFQVGKYDPSNERHLWVLDQLEISDSDLEELATEPKE